MEQFLSVDIGRVAPSATNPRKHFDKKDMADLTDSIKSKGIINPILVRPFGKGYEIVAGERRYRAAQEAKLDMIPVIVKDLDDEQALEVQVIENLQRADVHPLDEAEGYRQLKACNKYDEASIAAKVGKSVVYVYQRIQLLNLIDTAKKLFWSDKITITHAIHIARLEGDAQKKVIKHIEEEMRWRDAAPSVKGLVDFINRNVFMNLSAAVWKKDDARLDPKAGACSQCPKRTGFNKSLFEDIGKSDMCLDGLCYNYKLDLFTRAKVESSKDAGIPILEISEHTYQTKNGIVGWADYSVVNKKQAAKLKAAEAIYVDGNQKGKTVFVALKGKVNTDGGSGLSDADKIQRAKKRVENQKREIDRKFRIRLLKEIVDKVNTALSPDDLKDIAAQLMRSVARNEKNLLHAELSLAYKDHYGTDDLQKSKSELPKSDFEIAKLMMMLALASSADRSEFNKPDIKPLIDAANRYKIDHEEIQTLVEMDNPIKMPKILVEKKEAKKSTPKKTKKPAKK